MKQILDSLTALKTLNAPIEFIDHILSAALQAADPYSVVKNQIRMDSSHLTIDDISYILYPDSKIIVLAIGKASLAMTEAVVDQLGERISRGICVCKHNPMNRKMIGRVEIIQGSHPVPDVNSVEAANRIRGVVGGLKEHDIVVLLISGGGSALVCLPAEGVSLPDYQAVTSSLLKAGASINELNAVRKHLDLIKGGGLLKMAQPAQVAVLVISDVVNDSLDVIASGPAVPDPSTFQNALDILKKYIPIETIPQPIIDRFTNGCTGRVPETLKSGDQIAQKAKHTIVASNRVSALKAMQTAKEMGFQASLLTCELVGEAHLAGEFLADTIKQIPVNSMPIVCIAGGETTVKVKGHGLGGRNLEVALGAVRKMSGEKNSIFITLATDGEDGPTDAAGAFVSGETYNFAVKQGLNPDDYLANNDAYNFFKKVGGLILTGPTGTNVNDLNFIFRY